MMTEYERKKSESLEKAKAAERASDAQWTPEPIFDSVRETLDATEARLILEHLGNRSSAELDEGLEHLLDSMDLLKPILQEAGVWEEFIKNARDIESRIALAADAEAVLGEAGQEIRDRTVLLTREGRGRPKRLLAFEVENVFREMRPTPEGPPLRSSRSLGKGNTKKVRAAIRERLADRWPAEDLTDERLSQILRETTKADRQKRGE